MTTRALVLLVPLTVLAATTAFAQDVTPPAAPVRLGQAPVVASVVDPVVVPFELLANRPLVRVTINGQGPFALLLGPEEQTSQIDAELAELLKLKLPEAGQSPLTVDVAFSPRYTAKIAVAIQPLTRVAPELPAAMRPRGVVSLAAWADMLVTLDYSRWKISIEPGMLPEANRKDVFDLNAGGELRLPLSLGGDPIDCHVDPWFPGPLLLPATVLAEGQLAGEPRDQGSIHTKEATVRVREGRLAADVVMGPFEVKTTRALLADDVDTATVGTSWLARYAVTYDLANHRVRIVRPAGDATKH